MYYPSTQHDDYYEDGGWGLGACAGDADDPAGRHAGTQLGQKVTAADGSEHFIMWDKQYEIAIAHPFNQRAYEAYQRKVQQSGKPEKVFKGAVQFSNGKWGWVDKNDTSYIYRRLIDDNMPSYGDKEIFKRYQKYEEKRAEKNLPDTNWDQRAPARPPPSERRQQAPRAPRNFVIHDAGSGNQGSAAVQAGPPRGTAPAGRGRGRGGGAGPNFGNRGQPSAVPPRPPPPAAPRPPPTPAPPPAQPAGNYAAAAARPAAAPPAAAAPAGARAAAGARPVYDGKMKGDLPLLHLPEGTKTKFNQNDKREFSAWVKKFIKEFEQTNSTMMDVTRPLLDKLLPEDRAEISKQKRAYKDFFNYLYPNHVFPRQVTYRPAPPAPLPSQVAGKRPAQAQQAQKPTHKVVAVARELSNFFNGLSQKGMYVDSSGIAWIQRNNFAKQFDLFLDDLDDKKGNFSGCDPDSMFTFGTNTNLLCEFFEDKELLQKTRTMHFDDEILLGFYSGVKDNNVQNFFQGYMDDVDKGRVVKSLADIFKDVAEEIQAIIDQGQKMKSDSQIQKNALAAAKQVLEKDGASNADIADARTAVHAIRDQILNGVYAMETTNNNQIKVQFAAALMAYNADATDPTATLFFLLQKIIAVIPLPHFRKLVTASDLFKDALALYKELSKPPAAEGGAAAGGRPARQGMLPGVAAAPVAPAPHVAPRAAGGGGGGDDDWADGGEEDYQPTPEDIQNVMDMLERRKKASAGGNQGFFSGAGDDGWTDAGRGGQPRGKARLPDYSEGGGSNLAPGGTGFFGSGNRFEVLQDHRDPGAMPQRPRSRPARGELTDAPEATDVDLDIPEPAGGAAVAAIEETAAEERAASAAGSARSGRSASASAGGSSGRASSRSRSRARSESAGEPQRDEAVVPEQSDVTTTRAKSASAITSVERYNAWLMENPYASFEEKSAARMRFASMSSNLTLEEFHAMCDKAEQSLKFKQLSEKYEEYD